MVLRLPSGATTAGASAAPARGAIAAQPPSPPNKQTATAPPARSGRRKEWRGAGRTASAIMDGLPRQVGSGGTRRAHECWQHRIAWAEPAHAAIVEHQHLVGALQGLWTVGDQDGRGAGLLEAGEGPHQRHLAR